MPATMVIQAEVVEEDYWAFRAISAVFTDSSCIVPGTSLAKIYSHSTYHDVVVDGISTAIYLAGAGDKEANVGITLRPNLAIWPMPTMTLLKGVITQDAAFPINAYARLTGASFAWITFTAVGDTAELSMWGHWPPWPTTELFPPRPQAVDLTNMSIFQRRKTGVI